jgi:hypothetical protein
MAHIADLELDRLRTLSKTSDFEFVRESPRTGGIPSSASDDLEFVRLIERIGGISSYSDLEFDRLRLLDGGLDPLSPRYFESLRPSVHGGEGRYPLESLVSLVLFAL